MRLTPALVLLAISCNGDTGLTSLEPDIELPLSELDFDEVVIGTQLEIGFVIQNTGRGDLIFESVEFSETTAANFQIVNPPAEGDYIDPNGEYVLEVTYTPDEVKQEIGELTITSNDPDNPVLNLDVNGYGVEPEIDIDPETLWFGDLESGNSETLTFDVTARGYGRLSISDILFANPDEVAGTFELTMGGDPIPEDAFPMKFQPGEGQQFEVTCTPTSDAEWDQDIYIVSNDPDAGTSVVRLLANTEYTGEEPPTVEITYPDWSAYLMENQSVTLKATVTDDADDPSTLAGLWQFYYADTGMPTGFAAVSYGDASGNHTYTIDGGLPVGDITIKLQVTDSFNNIVTDEVDVKIWEEEEPVLYTLSGGSNLFDGWTADDDVTIYLDGTPIFTDANQTTDTHSPIEFEAEKGQTIRIVASDMNTCDLFLDALVLHWGTGANQTLNEEQCMSSCSSHSCYSPDYILPPNVYIDEEFVIEIP